MFFHILTMRIKDVYFVGISSYSVYLHTVQAVAHVAKAARWLRFKLVRMVGSCTALTSKARGPTMKPNNAESEYSIQM